MIQMKEAVRRRGAGPPQGKRTWGDDAFPRGLDVDSGGDRFELAHPLTQVGDLDPAARWREAAVAGLMGQFEALEFEPAIPGFQPRPACGGETDQHARAQYSHRV